MPRRPFTRFSRLLASGSDLVLTGAGTDGPTAAGTGEAGLGEAGIGVRAYARYRARPRQIPIEAEPEQSHGQWLAFPAGRLSP